MLLGSSDAHGDIVLGGAVAGLEFKASPAGTTKFSTVDNLVIGTTKISFQPAYPVQVNDYEPNVIVSADGLGKDIVLPVFAGQVSYSEVTALK
jgi:hypothetical protein